MVSPLLFTRSADLAVLSQNFFTNVKAIATEAKERSVASDGQHHYEQAEKDLLAQYVPALLTTRRFP